MSNKKELLQEAIADAKLVKEVAMLNAQKAIEESFAPHLKNMLSSKIQEMEDEQQLEEMAEARNDLEGVLTPYGTSEEIEMYMEKIKDNPDYDGWSSDEMIEDFKYFIQDKMDSASSDEPVEEEFDLDELLREMELEEKEELDENLIQEKDDVEDTEEKVEDDVEDDDDPEIDLENLSEEDLKDFIEEVISDMVEAGELEAGEEGEESDELGDDNDEDLNADIDDSDMEELMEVKSKLEESEKTIAELKSKLNESKLLSSKLLYANKIFKSKTLSEDKKIKVLEAFNKVSSIKEAKNTYELLNESLSSTERRNNNFSVKGFASKPGIIAENKTKTPILSEEKMFSRMQKLAGIL